MSPEDDEDQASDQAPDQAPDQDLDQAPDQDLDQAEDQAEDQDLDQAEDCYSRLRQACSMENATENSYAWVCIEFIMYMIVAPFAIYFPLAKTYEWLLVIPWALFLWCDVWFVLSPYTERSADECLENINSMLCLISYYIPAVAVILAFSDGSVLKEVYKEDPLAIYFLAVGAGASAIAMMWIPHPRYRTTEITRDGGLKPTKELKMEYLIVCFMEKVAIIFVLAGLLRFGQAILEMEEET